MLSIFANAIFVATRTDTYSDRPAIAGDEAWRRRLPRLSVPHLSVPQETPAA